MDKKRIMIVDDEEGFIRMLKMNLELSAKFEVMALSSAKDIVANVQAFKPDLILLDLIMPGIGGLEVCEMLNNDPIGKMTPIIILSALSKDIDKLKAYKLGIVDYITKPIETQKLITLIERSLEFKSSK